MAKEISKHGPIDNWRTTDDTVMGGVSASRFYALPSGISVFEGKVSLENNGGFSSLKGDVTAGEFAGCRGIKFKALGDGKQYKLFLKDHLLPGGINYQFEFTSETHRWRTYYCRFTEFVPVQKGKQVELQWGLKPENIKSVGFIISNKQAGSFKLEFEWIKKWKEGENGESH